MDKIQIFDDKLEQIMDSIPEHFWYNKSSQNDDSDQKYEEENLLILSNW